MVTKLSNLPDPKKYKKFFSGHGTNTCLQADFLLNGGLKKANMLATKRGNQFHIFLEIKGEEQCAKDGVKLFHSDKSYSKYISDFKKYIEVAKLVIIPKYSKVPEKMSKEEFLHDLEFISKFWYYYGMTEFPYIDLAHNVASKKKDKKILKRLLDFSKFKYKAREILNTYFYTNGVLQNLLKYVSRTFLDKKDDSAFYLFKHELIDCFKGKLPDYKIINGRRKCYAVSMKNSKLKIYEYAKAKKINSIFTKIEHKNEFTGISVNPGHAIGKAVILFQHDNQDSISELDKKMKKGDILVAETTTPNTIMLCKKAAAIVADEGGLLSHASVISRELKIPCIVGTKNATHIIKNGDIVEVDADKGIVRKIDK